MGSSGECFVLQVVGELHGCLVAWPRPQCWVLPSPMCIFGEQPSPSAGEGECRGMSSWLSDWVTQWNNPLWLHQETWSPDLWRILCPVKIESSLQDQLRLRCNHSKTPHGWSLGMGVRFATVEELGWLAVSMKTTIPLNPPVTGCRLIIPPLPHPMECVCVKEIIKSF